MKFRLSFFFLATLLILFSCGSQKSAAISNLPVSDSAVTETNNIVYLFFEIEKNGDNPEKITHTDTKITEGFLKNASVENKPPVVGNLLISILGNDGEIIEERIIEDPLNPMMEVFAEEGMSKEKMTLKKADFSVRFNQKGNVTAVKVEKITNNSKNPLITLKL